MAIEGSLSPRRKVTGLIAILPRQGECEVEHAPDMFEDRPVDDPATHSLKASEGAVRDSSTAGILPLRRASPATSPWRGRIGICRYLLVLMLGASALPAA